MTPHEQRFYKKLILQVVRQEREACAQVAEAQCSTLPPQAGDYWDQACREVAKCIRARQDVVPPETSPLEKEAHG